MVANHSSKEVGGSTVWSISKVELNIFTYLSVSLFPLSSSSLPPPSSLSFDCSTSCWSMRAKTRTRLQLTSRPHSSLPFKLATMLVSMTTSALHGHCTLTVLVSKWAWPSRWPSAEPMQVTTAMSSFRTLSWGKGRWVWPQEGPSCVCACV